MENQNLDITALNSNIKMAWAKPELEIISIKAETLNFPSIGNEFLRVS